MAKHRDLNFRKFAMSISPDLLRRYFERLAVDDPPEGWALLHGDTLLEYLSRPENSGLDAIVREDFRRVNDLCAAGMSIVADAYKKFDLPLNPDLSSEELAFALFLGDDQVWKFAWSRYLLYGLSGKIAVYRFAAGAIVTTDEKEDAFRTKVRESLGQQAKGTQCGVSCYNDDHGLLLIHIERGWYMRAVSLWNNEQVEIRSFRPALEDVVGYDEAESELKVKAAQDREGRDYVRFFAIVSAVTLVWQTRP